MTSPSRKRLIRVLIMGFAVMAAMLTVPSHRALGKTAPLIDDASVSCQTPLVVSVRQNGVSSFTASPVLGFTMADFTGDTHLDLATVKLDGVDSDNAHYRIEIRLSEGRSQTLAVAVLFGGLVITPKDVTGKGNLDLVVHATMSRSLVAIFLNNGSGHFDKANVLDYLALVGDEAPTVCIGQPEYHGITIGCPEKHITEHLQRSLQLVVDKNRLVVRSDNQSIARQHLPLDSNRAPPSA